MIKDASTEARGHVNHDYNEDIEMKQKCWVGTSMQSNCAGHLCLQKWTSISTHETLDQRQTNDGRGTSTPGPSGRAKLTSRFGWHHGIGGPSRCFYLLTFYRGIGQIRPLPLRVRFKTSEDSSFSRGGKSHEAIQVPSSRRQAVIWPVGAISKSHSWNTKQTISCRFYE
jgi:hypothetical protein